MPNGRSGALYLFYQIGLDQRRWQPPPDAYEWCVLVPLSPRPGAEADPRSSDISFIGDAYGASSQQIWWTASPPPAFPQPSDSLLALGGYGLPSPPDSPAGLSVRSQRLHSNSAFRDPQFKSLGRVVRRLHRLRRI